jgi:iron-sulfur cluster repair protein YtfE (RIC family)
MDAIELLTQQHREVEKLFEQYEKAGDRAEKREICELISDELAMHAALEERIFYPATNAARREEALHEAVEEHRSANRHIADIVRGYVLEEQIDAKMNVLMGQIEHHVEEEEKELFPKARNLLGAERLAECGEKMTELMEELESEGESRRQVSDDTDHAAPI